VTKRAREKARRAMAKMEKGKVAKEKANRTGGSAGS